MQSRTHIFDNTLGVPGEGSWLERKVLRRELTDNLERESLSERTQRARGAAESFLGEMSRKAELRDGMERKAEAVRRIYEEKLRAQADEYRERLRRKLRPELRD